MTGVAPTTTGTTLSTIASRCCHSILDKVAQCVWQHPTDHQCRDAIYRVPMMDSLSSMREHWKA
jgi:hypothetical protein